MAENGERLGFEPGETKPKKKSALLEYGVERLPRAINEARIKRVMLGSPMNRMSLYLIAEGWGEVPEPVDDGTELWEGNRPKPEPKWRDDFPEPQNPPSSEAA